MNKKYIKQFLLITAVLLLTASTAVSGLADGTLTLPKKLKTISTQAFYGDKTLGKVVLPSGIKEIQSQAFANSSLYEINLPDKLTYIADNAFDGPDKVTVIVTTKGTYAYNWAERNGYLYTPGKPVISKATASKNTITLSWKRVTGAYEYTVYYGTSSSISKAKSIAVGNVLSKQITGLEYNTTYYVWVKANNIIGTSAASASKTAKTAQQALTISENPSARTVPAGSKASFSVKAAGGTGTYTYQWYKASSSTGTGTKISGATKASYSFTASKIKYIFTPYISQLFPDYLLKKSFPCR